MAMASSIPFPQRKIGLRRLAVLWDTVRPPGGCLMGTIGICMVAGSTAQISGQLSELKSAAAAWGRLVQWTLSNTSPSEMLMGPNGMQLGGYRPLFLTTVWQRPSRVPEGFIRNAEKPVGIQAGYSVLLHFILPTMNSFVAFHQILPCSDGRGQGPIHVPIPRCCSTCLDETIWTHSFQQII